MDTKLPTLQPYGSHQGRGVYSPELRLRQAPATVTDEQIREAGRDIAAAGRRVSGYSLRAQLGGRGEPRRLMAVWEQTRQQQDTTPADQAAAIAAPPLPPDLATQAATLRDRLTAEFDAAIATAWLAAERRAAERLGGEVETARAAAEAARQAQAEADEALALADAARDAAEAGRDRLALETAEARAAADRATGQHAGAEAERRTATADAAREAAETSVGQARQIADAAREAAETVRSTTAAEMATARAQLAAALEKVETLTRTADAAMQRAQAEVDDVRRALTAAAEERGRLLQRAEVAEAQLAVLTAATGRPAS